MSGPGSFHPLGPAVIERAVESVSADERFVGLMLGGSSLTGETDEFSDLDLVVATRDADHGTALADSPEFAARLGPLLVCFTGEHVGEPRLLICLYGPPLLHVDLKFVALSDLASRVEDPIVLWEREARLIANATVANPAVWPAPQLQWIEDRFWVWIHYTAAKIGRGELYEALDALAALRRLVLGPMLAETAGLDQQGSRRLERHAGEHAAALAGTVGDLNAPGCREALRACADLYRTLRDHLDDGSLRRHAEAERLSLTYLDEL